MLYLQRSLLILYLAFEILSFTVGHAETLAQNFVKHKNENRAISVPEVARQITVRILRDNNAGSGVIVQCNKKLYTVLTNAHVVPDSLMNQLEVLTYDGVTHKAKKINTNAWKNLDLAIIQFTSDNFYQVVSISSVSIQNGDFVYASGFPNWNWETPKKLENTYSWGLKAYHLTVGNVKMILGRSLQEGYQVGYTNEIENGMSGGPVLNQLGQLVGVNGRLKYPFQGIYAYTLDNGLFPSEREYQQMKSLSWAVPISKLPLMFK